MLFQALFHQTKILFFFNYKLKVSEQIQYICLWRFLSRFHLILIPTTSKNKDADFCVKIIFN